MGMFPNENGKKLSFLDENGVSLTKQCFKDECDINRIVARAMANGLPPAPEPVYGSVLDVTPESFLEMKNRISEITGKFENLPSDMRRYYGSPEGYLESEIVKHKTKTASVEDQRKNDIEKGISPIKEDAGELVSEAVESVNK